MASNSHASLEARLDNNIALYIHLESLSKYNPTAPELKAAAIKLRIDTDVIPAMTPYRNAKEALDISQGKADAIFDKIHNIAIDIRSEVFETFYASEFYDSVNHYVRLITGENVSRYSAAHPKKVDDPATPENEAEWTSVSQLDRESRFGNYKSLISLLTEKGDYDPEDADIKIPKLQTLSDEARDILKELSTKGTTFTNARSLVLKFFDGPGGLSEIAARAKRNVKRNYGKDSPEYKALVNKAY
jgi:hypothetical protein